MLRLLFLLLILQGAVAASEDTEGYTSGDLGDDEDGEIVEKVEEGPLVFAEGAGPGMGESKGENGDGTMIIIIAAVCVAVLAICSIVAIVVIRRYLQKQEQGVYSVPAEQGQKAAV